MKKNVIFLSVALVVVLSCLIFNSFHGDNHNFEVNEELYGNHYGRDYMGSVGDGKFMIMRFAGKNALLINNSPDDYDFVLCNELFHKYDGDDLFFYSEEGIAVVYAKSNLCKVWLAEPPDGEMPELEEKKIKSNKNLILL